MKSTNVLAGWRSLAIIPFLWIGVVFLVGSFYSVLQTDDFCTWARLYGNSGDNPFLESWYMYMNWTGRYSASFVAAAVGWAASVAPFPIHAVYTTAIFVFVVVLAWTCVRVSSLNHADGRADPLLGMLCFAAMLALMPSKMEGVFWLTGAAVYSWGLVSLGLLFLSVRSDTEVETGAPIFSLRTLLLIAITAGFNEFLGMAAGAFLVLRLVLFARARPYLKQNVAYGVVFLGSFAATVLAPGNFVRNATMATPRHDVGMALTLAKESALMFVGGHLMPNLLLIGMLGVAAFATGWVARSPARKLRMLLPVCASLIAMFPVHLLVYTYLTGEHVPGRVINQAYAMVILGCLLLAAHTGHLARSWQQREFHQPAFVMIAAAGLMLATSPGMLATSKSIRDFGPTWRAEQLTRADFLNRASNSGHANPVVAPFSREPYTPPILQGTDISKDPTYWVNHCVANFYGLESVSLGAPPDR